MRYDAYCVFRLSEKFSPLKPLVSGDNKGMEQPKMASTYARPLGHVPLSHFFFHFSFFFYTDCLTPSLISDGFFPAGNISRLRDSAPRTDYQAYLRRQNLLLIGLKLTFPSIYFLIIIFYRITILPSEDKFIPMFERLKTFHQDFMTQYKD